jgi:hypothetical protein
LPFKGGTLREGKIFLQSFFYDNVHNETDYASSLDELTGVDRQRLRDGDWDYAEDEKCLCSLADIQAMFTNAHVLDTIGADKSISADLAMQGRDMTVAGLWRGNVVTIALEQGKSTGKTIERDLTELAEREGIPQERITVDSDGLGNYLIGYMPEINAFRGNASATNPEYANKKTECAYKLAEKVKKHEIYIICTQDQKEKIIQEMGVLKVKSLNADEKKKAIISKDEMKKELLRSPDYLDMLIMGQALEVDDWGDFGVFY